LIINRLKVNYKFQKYLNSKIIIFFQKILLIRVNSIIIQKKERRIEMKSTQKNCSFHFFFVSIILYENRVKGDYIVLLFL
jgi:hypothetical protein